jgi:hypothetical protein
MAHGIAFVVRLSVGLMCEVIANNTPSCLIGFVMHVLVCFARGDRVTYYHNHLPPRCVNMSGAGAEASGRNIVMAHSGWQLHWLIHA